MCGTVCSPCATTPAQPVASATLSIPPVSAPVQAAAVRESCVLAAGLRAILTDVPQGSRDISQLHSHEPSQASCAELGRQCASRIATGDMLHIAVHSGRATCAHVQLRAEADLVTPE